jgi:hypothetical protein
MNFPSHGRVACSLCHRDPIAIFDSARTQSGDWRITYNPLAWGNPAAEVAVLGFSKGPTQAGALAREPHNSIAFKGGRASLAKILHHVGLIEMPAADIIDRAVADPNGRFHFGSLIRCTVEGRHGPGGTWTGTGGGMLDKFVATTFGRDVLRACTRRHLGILMPNTKLVLMLGMGSRGNYIRECRRTFAAARPGSTWSNLNEVSYTDGSITVVHTEHFKSQGALLPNWLSETGHPRGQLGLWAREGVAHGLRGGR